MATVCKATIDQFDRIYPLLEFFHVEGMTRENWFRLLSKRWSPAHDHFGYVLMEGDQAVGFLGAFFSERKSSGRSLTFCNLFCWHVLEDYRKQSLLLLRPILNLQNMPSICLTL